MYNYVRNQKVQENMCAYVYVRMTLYLLLYASEE